MMNETKEWPLWICMLIAEIVLTIPFLFVLNYPVSALVCWLVATTLYILPVAVFGKGHVIEGAVAALILALMAAMLIPAIHRARERHALKDLRHIEAVNSASHVADDQQSPKE